MSSLRRAVLATDDPAVVRNAALGLLARREHSLSELATKLVARLGPDAPVNEVLAQLCDAGLQSDERFAESFVRAQRRRGHGPLRILHELGMRGIARELATACVDAGAPEWAEVAREWKRKRHGDAPPATAAERQRIARQLQQRGFDFAQIRQVLG